MCSWDSWAYRIPLQWSKTTPNMSVLDMTLNSIWWWGSSTENLGSVRYTIIAIAPSSWSGSICWGPICRANRTIQSFIGLIGRVFTNALGDQDSIPGQVIPKTQKIVLDASLLNPQHYKVWIKGEVEQSRERSSALPYTSV